MNKILLSLIVIIFGISLITNAQIPNSGFENWTGGDPDSWASSNVFPAGLVNIFQTTDNHSGTYALKGEVVDFFGTNMAPIVQSGPGAAGFPITEQYRSFELYYKFTSSGGDKFSVNVGLEKNGTPIAQGAVAIPTTIGTYTFLSVPLTYMIEDVPDLAIIQISITGPVTGPDVHVGSVMFIDDLAFSLETGIDKPATPGLITKCYPNPASDIINILLNENSGDVLLKVFDTYGKEVKSMDCYQQNGNDVILFSVADLPSGLYFYSLNGQGKQYSGKFSVSR